MTSAEELIRPFISVASEPTLRPRTPPVDEEPEAFISWGQPSQFTNPFREAASDPGGAGFVEEPDRSYQFTEEARTWQDIRIFNPEDEEQSVIIRRANEIAFSAPNVGFGPSSVRGRQLRMSFGNQYSPADPIPGYLKNEDNEEFDPIVLDPFTTVIEVGWANEVYIVVTLLFVPYRAATTGLEINDPSQFEYRAIAEALGFWAEKMNTFNVNFGGSEIIFVNDQPVEVPAGEQDITKAYMGTLVEGNVSDDPPQDDYIHESRPVGFTPVEEALGEVWSPSIIQSTELFGWGFAGFERDHFLNNPFNNALGQDQDLLVGVLLESEGADASELFADANADEADRDPPQEWRLDSAINFGAYDHGATQPIHNYDGAAALDGVLTIEDWSFDVDADFHIYRLWVKEWTETYDAAPLWYGAHFLNVTKLWNDIGRAYNQATSPSVGQPGKLLTIDILAGDTFAANDPIYPQKPFAPNRGRVRWAMYKGQKGRETVQAILGLTFADNTPEEQIWEGLLKGNLTGEGEAEGLVAFEEQDFPTGNTIEGSVVGHMQLEVSPSSCKFL